MANNKNLPPPAAFVDPATGILTRQANNFLNAITASSNTASSGEVTTLPGSGLEGGGFVADGIDLSIAPNGVTFAMFQETPACSVVGRFQNSTGDVGAIQAVTNDTILARIGDQLAFYPMADVGVGTVTTVSVATANGFSGTVANPTTTPEITIIAGDITPDSVEASGSVKALDFYLGANIFADLSSNYHELYAPGTSPRLYLGNATDPANYYDNATHYIRSDGGGAYIIISAIGDYINDAAAALGGVPVSGMYRNGSVLMIRVT